ncbi:LacI family DNA-binding transcriptional regulator [Agromyces laixinhei]|uniref:LacI family DNA-binding transcriptional regulator n=1 Tax=Agromyces laixinhei TaxID=2585717 RepID=UPI0018DB1418|nr:LacI family DNA-binding transcriptional regulator [Agromyces laixinhei]
MTRSVNIYEVAEAAGVSIATVSNTLNRPARVAADTRERVMQTIDRLGFVPHYIAAHRARTTLDRIGVIAPFTSYSSFGVRLEGILRALRDTGKEVLVFDHESAARTPSPLLSSLPLSGRLDALIIMGVPVDQALAERLQERRLPTVLIDSHHSLFTNVVVNDERGGYLAGRHLIEKGLEHFLYVSEGQLSSDYVSQGQRRTAGFMRAIIDAGYPRERVKRITVSSDSLGGRMAAEQLLATRGHALGILAHHDLIAAGMVATLRQSGASVPGDFSIVGYDGGPIAESFGLTTVRQPLEHSGFLGAQHLLRLMNDSTEPSQQIAVSVELIEGNTT